MMVPVPKGNELRSLHRWCSSPLSLLHSALVTMKRAKINVLGLSLACLACAHSPTPRYAAGFVDDHQHLHIFSSAGTESDVALGIIPLEFAPDGESVYGHSADRFDKGLYRVTIDSLRSEVVPGTQALRIGAIAMSPEEDKIVISGGRIERGAESCGLFYLRPAVGTLVQIAAATTCDYAQSWERPSLSPDGRRIVAYRKPRLEIIEIEKGTVQPIAGYYIAGAWSPDGKWLAVLEGEGAHRTILLDSTSLKQVRVLGESNVLWSPDSRMLLGARTRGCFPYWSSLVAIDVATGRESVFSASRCKVNLNTFGWVAGRK